MTEEGLMNDCIVTQADWGDPVIAPCEALDAMWPTAADAPPMRFASREAATVVSGAWDPSMNLWVAGGGY
jgi:hypothetical protein